MSLLEVVKSFIYNHTFLSNIFDFVGSHLRFFTFLHLLFVIFFVILNYRTLCNCFKKIKKRTWLLVFVILLLGTYLRLTLTQSIANTENFTYEAQAVCLSASHRTELFFCHKNNYGGDHPLGWPIILSLIYTIFPVGTLTAAVFALVISIMSIILMFLAAYTTFNNEKIALYSSFLWAIFPLHIAFSAQPSSEFLSEFFLLSALLVFAVTMKKSSWKMYSLLFVLMAYCVQIRVDNNIIFIIFLLFILYTKRKIIEYKKMLIPLFLSLFLLLGPLRITLTYQLHSMSFRAFMHNIIGYLGTLCDIFCPVIVIIIIALIGLLSDLLIEKDYKFITILSVLLGSYISVQLLFIFSFGAVPWDYMYVHTSSFLVIILGAGIYFFSKSILSIFSLGSKFSTVVFAALSLFILLTIFFSPQKPSPYLRTRTMNGYGFIDILPNKIPFFYKHYKDSLYGTIVDASRHINKSDYLIYIHPCLSTEVVLVETENPFIDFSIGEHETTSMLDDLFRNRYNLITDILKSNNVFLLKFNGNPDNEDQYNMTKYVYKLIDAKFDNISIYKNYWINVVKLKSKN